MNVRCFFLESIGRSRLTLRRYSRDEAKCPVTGWSYHNAEAPLFDVAERYEFDPYFNACVYRHDGPHSREEVPAEFQEKWPQQCACGHSFTDADPYQVFSDHLYRRIDTEEILTDRNAPVGAMWWAPWADQYFRPQLEHVLAVMTPGGVWMPDHRATNCTMPDDSEHKCWILRGTPPDCTVDKDGNTCAAGAGSILIGGYHGFLRNGQLEGC
jgi:hypothetical protein